MEALRRYYKPWLLGEKKYLGGKGRGDMQAKDGQDIIKLSSNENVLGPSLMALKAIRQQLQSLHEYPERSDIRLRQALANHYGDILSVDAFLTASSASEVIDIICRALLEPGSNVIVSSPTFLPFRVFAANTGAMVRDIPLRGPDFYWDMEAVLAAIDEHTRLVFVGSPNNPTGSYVRSEQMQIFIQELPGHVGVVYDEVYHHFTDAPDYSTAMAWVSQGHPLIGVNSFSKAYGLAGLRVGYAYTTPELATYLRQLSKPFLISSVGMAGALAALKDEDHLMQTVRLIDEQKSRLYHIFEALGVTYWPSQGNFVLFQLPLALEVVEDFMQQSGVMIRPIQQHGDNFLFRVTVGTSAQMFVFRKALCALISTYHLQSLHKV